MPAAKGISTTNGTAMLDRGLAELVERMEDFDEFVQRCLDEKIVKPKHTHHLEWLRMRVVENMTYAQITDESLEKHPYQAKCLKGHHFFLEESEYDGTAPQFCKVDGCKALADVEMRDSLTPRVVCKSINKLLKTFGAKTDN